MPSGRRQPLLDAIRPNRTPQLKTFCEENKRAIAGVQKDVQALRAGIGDVRLSISKIDTTLVQLQDRPTEQLDLSGYVQRGELPDFDQFARKDDLAMPAPPVEIAEDQLIRIYVSSKAYYYETNQLAKRLKAKGAPIDILWLSPQADTIKSLPRIREPQTKRDVVGVPSVTNYLTLLERLY